MKLIDILPEIEKGRKFKRTHWISYHDKNSTYAAVHPEALVADDWELEPLKEEISIRLDLLRVNTEGRIETVPGMSNLSKLERKHLAHAIEGLLNEVREEKEE